MPHTPRGPATCVRSSRSELAADKKCFAWDQTMLYDLRSDRREGLERKAGLDEFPAYQDAKAPPVIFLAEMQAATSRGLNLRRLIIMRPGLHDGKQR